MSITRADCERQGGTYVPAAPDGSGPACRFIDYSKPVGQQVTYTPLDEGFSDWIARTTDLWSDKIDTSLGAAVQARDDTVTAVTTAAQDAAKATGLDQGLLGAASKLLGVNLNVVLIVLALLAFYIVKKGYLGDALKVIV